MLAGRCGSGVPFDDDARFTFPPLSVCGRAPTGYTLLVTGAFSGTFALNERKISGAVGAGSYTLRVVATNSCGSSAPTSPQTVTIP